MSDLANKSKVGLDQTQALAPVQKDGPKDHPLESVLDLPLVLNLVHQLVQNLDSHLAPASNLLD